MPKISLNFANRVQTIFYELLWFQNANIYILYV